MTKSKNSGGRSRDTISSSGADDGASCKPADHPMKRRILGVDPGLLVTGYGVVEEATSGVTICEAGVIRAATGGVGDKLARRLNDIFASLGEVLDQFRPKVVAVEQLYAHYAHPRTAILMAHARGVIFLAAAQRGIPVVSYNATRVKKTVTGSGRASKDQVQRTIQREFGLAKPPEPADVADALAVALCHFHIQRSAANVGR